MDALREVISPSEVGLTGAMGRLPLIVGISFFFAQDFHSPDTSPSLKRVRSFHCSVV